MTLKTKKRRNGETEGCGKHYEAVIGQWPESYRIETGPIPGRALVICPK